MTRTDRLERRTDRHVPPTLVWLVAVTWRAAFLGLVAGVAIVGLYRRRVVVPINVAVIPRRGAVPPVVGDPATCSNPF